jgi:hypothetical protein
MLDKTEDKLELKMIETKVVKVEADASNDQGLE